MYGHVCAVNVRRLAGIASVCLSESLRGAGTLACARKSRQPVSHMSLKQRPLRLVQPVEHATIPTFAVSYDGFDVAPDRRFRGRTFGG